MIALANFNEADARTTIDKLRGKRIPDVALHPLADRVRLTAISGSLVLALGVCLPAYRLPVLGQQTLWQLGMSDGVAMDAIALFVLALLSLFLAVKRYFAGLWLTSFVAFITLALSGACAAEIAERTHISLAAISVSTGLKANLIWHVFPPMMLDLGWWVMGLGIALLVVAAVADIVREVRRPPVTPLLFPPLRGTFTFCGRG
jgi:hypothetical protein